MELVKLTPKTQEISILEIIQLVKKYWNYLLTKWIVILVVGLSG